jgi:3-oxoacyl-[acyl-carrier protein] reductase
MVYGGNMDLKGKVAFITGGARGIGKEIAALYAKNGADIIICDIAEDILDKSASELREFKVKAEGYLLDVRDLKKCEDVVKKAIDNFGRIDILVNNAGITRDNLLIRMSEDEFDSVIAINLKGVFNCTKIVSRIMMRQRYGRIINMASIVGIRGNAGQVNYSSSKAGILGLTKSAAQELGSRNITVNAIAPGYIKTEMTDVLPDEVKEQMLATVPLKRPGTPVDVANAALFLASDYSSYITGQVIVVDGGMVM